ncbi:MAG: poly-gamma-glutamate capsule biosynthesis protein CapA/YwtB (metallophosphatase superfamily) [Myxococcota bacterium]|jgi:poly-gamma-glutamate capsule biosynthesis protein CapA/YwtB (metallophosphatase superfamily)
MRYLLAGFALFGGVWGVLVPAAKAAPPEPLVLVGGGDTAYPTGWFSERARKRGAGMFEPLQPILSSADLRFLNLESPVTKRKAIAKKKYPLVTHPDFLEILTGAGFNLFSLANNHTGDAGPEGLTDTFGHLKRLQTPDRPLWWSGAGHDKASRKKPVFFTIKGTRVALLSFRLSGSPLGNPMGAGASERQIRAAAKQADVVIVSAHGGGEYKAVPGSWKADKWRKMVDAGADVVLGHGPHNPQGVEWYKGAAIYYSLGNLSFGTRPPTRRTGGMILKGLMARVTLANGKVQKAEAIPLFVDNTRSWTAGGKTLKVQLFTPVPVVGPHFDVMLGEIRDWSAGIRGNKTKIKACGTAYCFGAP